MDEKRKELLKKKKEELDVLLDEKEFGKLKDLEFILQRISKDIKEGKLIDNKEQLEDIKKAINEIPDTFSFDGVEKKIELLKDEIIKLPKKEYSSELRKFYQLLEKIKIENYKKDFESLEKVIENKIDSIEFKDYSELLTNVKDGINSLLSEGKKIKKVKVTNFPEFNKINKIIEKVVDILKAVLNVFVSNKEPEDAIPVRLVDSKGKTFYESRGGAARGGGAVGIDLTTLENNTGSATSVGDGTRTVTTAGTRVQLSVASVPCKRVFIQAHESNSNSIVIGGITVVAALVGRRGFAIFPTQGDWFNINNLNLIWIDSLLNDDKVNYFYEN